MGFGRWITHFDGWSGVSSEAKNLNASLGRGMKSVAKGPVGKVAGKAGLLALGAGALVLGTAAYFSSRNDRRYNENTAPIAPDLAMPIPQVMDVPQMQPQTLMGETPVAGPMAQRILAERSGMSSGINPGNPNLGDIDGSGQAPQVLGR